MTPSEEEQQRPPNEKLNKNEEEKKVQKQVAHSFRLRLASSHTIVVVLQFICNPGEWQLGEQVEHKCKRDERKPD